MPRTRAPSLERVRVNAVLNFGRIDLLGDSRSAAQPVDVSGPVHETAPSETLDLIERLGELRKAGVLTEAEFVAKKADLLRRL